MARRNINYRKPLIDLMGGECIVCGSGAELEIHHVVPAKDGGSDWADNLVLLCHKHHNMVQNGMIQIDLPLRIVMQVKGDYKKKLSKIMELIGAISTEEAVLYLIKEFGEASANLNERIGCFKEENRRLWNSALATKVSKEKLRVLMM